MQKDYDKKIIACLPAFNEEKTIANVIKRLKNYVNEAIVCDNESYDMTLLIIHVNRIIVR